MSFVTGPAFLRFRPNIAEIYIPADRCGNTHGAFRAAVVGKTGMMCSLRPMPSHHPLLIPGPNFVAVIFVEEDEIVSAGFRVYATEGLLKIKSQQKRLLIVVVEGDYILGFHLSVDCFDDSPGFAGERESMS